MSFNVSAISSTNYVRNVNFGAKAEKANNAANVGAVEHENPEDSLEFQHKKQGKELTVEDKQQILKKARTNAAGWSILGQIISTGYYALRSDKTVAEKYDLDVEKDKDFIKKIKHDQMLATLPGALLPAGGGLLAYLYCSTQPPSKIDVD